MRAGRIARATNRGMRAPGVASRMPLAHPPFERLAHLVAHDDTRLRKILVLFHRTTVRDLLDLEHAAAQNDWPTVRRLAHRVAMSCLHVGERRAADALLLLSDATSDFAASAIFRDVYSTRRERVIEVVARVESFLMG